MSIAIYPAPLVPKLKQVLVEFLKPSMVRISKRFCFSGGCGFQRVAITDIPRQIYWNTKKKRQNKVKYEMALG